MLYGRRKSYLMKTILVLRLPFLVSCIATRTIQTLEHQWQHFNTKINDTSKHFQQQQRKWPHQQHTTQWPDCSKQKNQEWAKKTKQNFCKSLWQLENSQCYQKVTNTSYSTYFMEICLYNTKLFCVHRVWWRWWWSWWRRSRRQRRRRLWRKMKRKTKKTHLLRCLRNTLSAVYHFGRPPLSFTINKKCVYIPFMGIVGYFLFHTTSSDGL